MVVFAIVNVDALVVKILKTIMTLSLKLEKKQLKEIPSPLINPFTTDKFNKKDVIARSLDAKKITAIALD